MSADRILNIDDLDALVKYGESPAGGKLMEIPRSNWTLIDDEDPENERSVVVLAIRQKLAETVTMHLLHINSRAFDWRYMLPDMNSSQRNDGKIHIIEDNGALRYCAAHIVPDPNRCRGR